MDEGIEFRLKRYNYKSWCIQERHVKTTGDNIGEWTDWTDYKYPGSLANAVNGLFNLAITDQTGFENQAELLAAIAAAEANLLEHFQSLADVDL